MKLRRLNVAEGIDYDVSHATAQDAAEDIDQSSDVGQSVDLPDQEAKEIIAKQESRIVFRLKLVMLLLLLLLAVGTAVALSYYIENEENHKFTMQFQDDAFKVLQALGASLEQTMGAYDAFSVAISSSARSYQETWPNVTLPDFGIRAAKTLESGAGLSVHLLPFVSPEQRAGWEAYASGDGENIGWVNETLAFQESWGNYYGPRDQWGWTAHDVIHGDVGDVPYNETRILMPTWQNFPLVLVGGSAPANWDWNSYGVSLAMETFLDRQNAIITRAFMIPKPDDPIAEAQTELWASWFAHFLEPGENSIEPASEFFYPIVDDFNKVNNTVVGMIAGSFYWRMFLRDILPYSSKGIVIVFGNPCNEAFTYQIDGPYETYLGTGDVHDRKYSSFGVHSDLLDLGRFALHDSKYTGTPLDESYCPFTLSVYPSDDMHALYSSNDSLIFAFSALGIFMFTSLVFILYDLYVEKRQKMVMTRAERSSAIVSSLFPSAVRDQLFEQQEEAPKKSEHKSRNRTLQSNTYYFDDSEDGETLLQTGSPIANLYENTTIMFADLVGFTHWSSSRAPFEVFKLLETLFGAFDDIAKRRHVFKVETVGDCYVAAAGLPSPQKDHAVIMARFAQECLIQMNKIKLDLVGTLGAGTSDLALRIGLNSGPTTAGVLRGEKSRFQLFGGTVTTAARMESHSRPNQIMVSQSTADLISLSGKSHWLIQRQDSVEAKGKGAVQGYWCTPKQLSKDSDDRLESELAMPDVCDNSFNHEMDHKMEQLEI